MVTKVQKFFKNIHFFWTRKESSEISLGQKTLFLGQKNLFLRQKQGFLNIPNLWNIQNLFYSELSENYKNDVKIKLRKSQKTCSDSNFDSNIRVQVWNAVPYRKGFNIHRMRFLNAWFKKNQIQGCFFLTFVSII